MMIRVVDDFLNSLTMYKTVLYGLILLTVASFIASFMGELSYGVLDLLNSLGLLVIFCFFANFILAKLFKAPVNSESYLITAFILFFIMTPSIKFPDEFLSLISISIIAMASKYIFAFRKRHIFNPVAIAAVIMTFFGFGASWWIATPVLFPAVLIIGLLVIRKVRKFSLTASFAGVVCVEMIIFGFLYSMNPIQVLTQLAFSWPVFFLAAFMLTEPLTTPPTKSLQILYGALVGFLFAFQLPLGSITLTPEIALVIGNIFSYVISSKQRVMLRLEKIENLSPTLYNFIFSQNEKFIFNAGQYAEWTLPHKKADIRGNRRFFTIASSPTEKDIMLGVRIEEESSSFKKFLKSMTKKDILSIGNLKGDFTLPDDKNEKLVFIASGIGITPFRSMVKYLTDKNEKRDIVLIHACSRKEDFVYEDVFSKAQALMGLKYIKILNSDGKIYSDFSGYYGHLTKEVIKKDVGEFKNRKYFLSGSNQAVSIFQEILFDLKIPRNKIITDYFSGY